MAYTTINKSTDYFNTKLYTGNNGTQSITGVGHQPDLIWVKARNDTANHTLTDVIRGTNSVLYTNQTQAPDTPTNAIKSFDSDGFSVGSNGSFNANSINYASWNWKANGQGSSNTDGSINTTYTSVSTTAGFSISKYTGTGSNATVGHGLGSVPKMIIVKRLSGGTGEWGVYHASLGNTKALYLNGNSASSTETAFWNSTSPTSSVFSVGTANDTNGSGSTYIAYAFADVQGYSKVSGSYTGNGNADGSFIYTGFKPALILIKQTNATGSWYMWDNKRDTFNPYQRYISPNNANAEYTSSERWLDSLSNGFKWRNTETAMNGSGSSYIFMAFAEAPLVGSNNIPCTAR